MNCCVAEGGDLYECCEASAPFSWRYSMNECDSVAHKTPEPTPAEPSCKGDYSACQGCSGEQCTYCAAMEDIKCCLSTGADSLASDIGRVGLLQSCCDASAPFSWRYNDECQALVDDDDDDDDDDTATQPPTVTPEVEWRLGDAGDSCDETCEEDGLACAEDYLEESNAQLDFMDVLGPLGLGCTSVRGPKPNYAAPYVNHKGKCFVKQQTSTYSCSKSGSTKRRVCACSVRKHASSSGRFVASARVTPVGAGLSFVAVLALGAVGMRAANRKRALLPTTVTTGDGAEAAANPRARKLRNPMKNPKQFAPKTNAFSAPGAPAGGAGGQLELEYTTN